MKWLAFLLCALFLSASSLAQTEAEKYGKRKAERAKNRTERRADNRVNQKVDQAVDGVLDGVEGLFKKKNKNNDNGRGTDRGASEEETDSPDLGGLFGGSAKTADRYTYDLTVVMQIDVTDKKGRTETSNLDMLYAREKSYSGARMDVGNGAQGTSIIDFEHQSMIVITDEENAMVINMRKAMDRAKKQLAKTDTEETDYSFRKTGETRTIAGYTTHEFEVKDEETTSYFYMAPDLAEYAYSGTEAMNLMGQQNKNMPTVAGTEGSEGMGLFLAMESVDKKGERTVMTATKVDKTPFTILMSDYKIMSVPGM